MGADCGAGAAFSSAGFSTGFATWGSAVLGFCSATGSGSGSGACGAMAGTDSTKRSRLLSMGGSFKFSMKRPSSRFSSFFSSSSFSAGVGSGSSWPSNASVFSSHHSMAPILPRILFFGGYSLSQKFSIRSANSRTPSTNPSNLSSCILATARRLATRRSLDFSARMDDASRTTLFQSGVSVEDGEIIFSISASSASNSGS